ncbi:MAG: Hsp20/alpha crystallin family protein [Acidobacteriota bacterium]
MFGLTHTTPFDDLFRLSREMDALFNRVWGDLSTHPWTPAAPGVQVRSTDDGWKVSVPMPGVDPRDVTLEVAGRTVHIRAEVREEGASEPTRLSQSFVVPQFLDIDRLSAQYRHGRLDLTLPLKESVKPRRIAIENATSDTRQLVA